jgi:hypothetical protein
LKGRPDGAGLAKGLAVWGETPCASSCLVASDMAEPKASRPNARRVKVIYRRDPNCQQIFSIIIVNASLSKGFPENTHTQFGNFVRLCQFFLRALCAFLSELCALRFCAKKSRNAENPENTREDRRETL